MSEVIRFVCSYCRLPEIRVDMPVEWSVEKQRWESPYPFDAEYAEGWCDQCEDCTRVVVEVGRVD